MRRPNRLRSRNSTAWALIALLVITNASSGTAAGEEGDDQDLGPPRAVLDGHWSAVWTIEFSPIGDMLAAASVSDGAITLWDTRKAQHHAMLETESVNAYSLAFSPDGRTLAGGYWGWGPSRKPIAGSIKLWDVVNGHVRAELTHEPPRGIHRLAYSPDNKTLAAIEVWHEPQTGRKTQMTTIWDTVTHRVRRAV